MKAIYIADDGAQFDDEDECAKHDHEVKLNAINFTILGPDFNKIDTSDFDRIERIGTYLTIPTSESLKIIRDFLYDFLGLTITKLDHPGIFKLNENQGIWEDIDELIEIHQNELDKLVGAKKKLEQCAGGVVHD